MVDPGDATSVSVSSSLANLHFCAYESLIVLTDVYHSSSFLSKKSHATFCQKWFNIAEVISNLCHFSLLQKILIGFDASEGDVSDCWIRNWSHIATHLVLLVGATIGLWANFFYLCPKNISTAPEQIANLTWPNSMLSTCWNCSHCRQLSFIQSCFADSPHRATQ